MLNVVKCPFAIHSTHNANYGVPTGVVEQWWGQKDERERQVLRDQLSRQGVEQGRNHKPGVVDKGHGCGKPLGMPNVKTAQSSGAIGGGVLGDIGDAISGKSKYDSGYSGSSSSNFGKAAGEAVGGGALGGLVGGIAGAVGGNLLGEAFGGSDTKVRAPHPGTNTTCRCVSALGSWVLLPSTFDGQCLRLP